MISGGELFFTGVALERKPSFALFSSGILAGFNELNEATKNLDAAAQNIVGAFFDREAFFPEQGVGVFDVYIQQPSIQALLTASDVFSLSKGIKNLTENAGKLIDSIDLLARKGYIFTRTTKDLAIVQFLRSLKDLNLSSDLKSIVERIDYFRELFEISSSGGQRALPEPAPGESLPEGRPKK